MVALQICGARPVPVQVPEPLPVLGISEVLMGPGVDLLEALGLIFLTRKPIGEQRSDNGFIVGPPVLHLVYGLLRRKAP